MLTRDPLSRVRTDTLAVKQGGWVYTAGHLPFKEDMKNLHIGRVGVEYTAEQGADLAKITGLELIASLKNAVGDLDKVKRIVKVNGYIACPDSFTALPAVLNGCSNLLGEVFEDKGVHARAAVGVTSLPCAPDGYARTPTRPNAYSVYRIAISIVSRARRLGVPIEIDLIAEVED